MRAAQGMVNLAWGVHPQRSQLPVPSEKAGGDLTSVHSGSGGWLSLIREPFMNAWQRNVELNLDTVLTFGAVYRCIALISSDIAKMRMRLVEKDENGIWHEAENSAFSPVLRKPNRYQNRIQFFKNWLESKLIHGNTYVLKERDARGVVTRLHILDPTCVTVLVAPDGAVYYELKADMLAGVPDHGVVVPAREIIHDRCGTTSNHPLVGIPPIRAAALSATQGIKIQNQSARLFDNNSHPGGILTAPQKISDEQVRRLKEYWQQEYSGNNVGKVAVLGDGLKFERMAITAEDAQLIEQLKWSDVAVASAFGVPAYKIDAAAMPTHNNIEALNAQYYNECLQIYVEEIEESLDEGLGILGTKYGTEFDLDDLLRMDSATQADVVTKLVGGGVLAPDEGRAKFGLRPTPGGETPYLQEQNWPLRHLAERPLPGREVTAPEQVDEPPPEETQDDDGGDETRAYIAAIESIERASRRYERSTAA